VETVVPIPIEDELNPIGLITSLFISELYFNVISSDLFGITFKSIVDDVVIP